MREASKRAEEWELKEGCISNAGKVVTDSSWDMGEERRGGYYVSFIGRSC